MYGVPKLHKDGVPLRPILSMVNSPHHPLAKWLATVLKPVVDLYSVHTVKDTFDFCKELEKFTETNKDQLANTFLCSFDIASLFTNIPLIETIEICLDALYRNELVKKPEVPEQLMKKMLLKATTEVEFRFNGILYKQIDGVAMGSPLGPVLTNIFVGHCESRVSTDLFPSLYKRYVDDTFSAFSSERKEKNVPIFFSKPIFVAQKFRKWNNIKGSPCSICQKMGPNIAIFDLVKYGVKRKKVDLLAFRQQFWQLLELQVLWFFAPR